MKLERKRDLSLIDDDDLIASDLKLFVAIKNFRLMQLGEAAVKLVIERLNLEGFLSYFNEFNSTTAPYHGKYHSYCMVLNCYEGALHEKLSPTQTRALVVAALFHDFDHSGGSLSDEKNIELALKGLSLAQVTERVATPLSDQELAQAVSAIKITKYPFEKQPDTILERIIRDADLMQIYEESTPLIRQQYLGLKSEIEKARNVKYGAQEYATGQDQWLKDNVVWYTAWAQRKALVRDWESARARLFTILSA